MFACATSSFHGVRFFEGVPGFQGLCMVPASKPTWPAKEQLPLLAGIGGSRPLVWECYPSQYPNNCRLTYRKTLHQVNSLEVSCLRLQLARRWDGKRTKHGLSDACWKLLSSPLHESCETWESSACYAHLHYGSNRPRPLITPDLHPIYTLWAANGASTTWLRRTWMIGGLSKQGSTTPWSSRHKAPCAYTALGTRLLLQALPKLRIVLPLEAVCTLVIMSCSSEMALVPYGRGWRTS